MSLNLHQYPAIEVGDPNQFAFRVEFVPNLDAGFATKEEDLSWGRFQIWAAGRNLCEHIDRGEVRKATEWYLLPLFEWLIESWDFLLHEQRTPVSNSGDTAWLSLAKTNKPEQFDRPIGWDIDADESHSTWLTRHSLSTCRSGGLFPDVVIRRWRHEIELSWGESAVAGAPEGFRFLHGTGLARIDPEQVAKPLYEVLRQAVLALSKEQPQSLYLKNLAKKIVRLNNPNRQLIRTAVLAGLGDRVEMWEERWKRLCREVEEECKNATELVEYWLKPTRRDILCVSGSCEAAVMFGSASPKLTEADVLDIAVELVKTSQIKPTQQWTNLTGSPQPLRIGESPWNDGYRLAQDWARKTDLKPTAKGFVDVEKHINQLGIRVGQIDLDDSGTAGLAIQPKMGAPSIFVNRRYPRSKYPSGRRFVIAHELCHLLHDHAHGQDLAIVSGPWAPKELEQRANAFAAALLMPPDLIRGELETLGRDPDFKFLLVLAKRLKVSPDALAHHLENCGLISETTRDGLLTQLVNRPQ